jgi:predicted  nucleic acid-binding Zn-ribbon protein
MFKEVYAALQAAEKDVKEQARDERIVELEQSLDFYKNAYRQHELQILRLENRLALIRNYLNGSADDKGE